ncbi:tripartite tricarboxylate transporter substrate binding protein [Ramlibacter sp. AW1]|uniref:Tripartite tricarboxylate transporter substrate binding protein n=1 Tax=Ramlibacter aurantiacus TaxID=2801330 RepID=A0A936ZMM2_9BURK|nr:tripartite tricarboxylate transporter substrate binding protein [Ramlibacter aurantiacus]MBL0420070.1 tripartite tricarboxylate transporter substrate binding protein [Ramlibacter aurantiacus]
MIRALFTALVAGSAALAAAPSFAQGYPSAPITVVIPLAPGDAADTAARAMSEELSRQLKTPIVVQNRPGAGGSIGVQAVTSARPDGYTILFTQNGPLTIRRVFEPAAAGFDPLKELTPLAITTRTPSILVARRDAPFNTFEEMVAHAKRNPGGVRVGNAGPGSAGDVSVHIINAQAGTDMTSVPYKGAAPAVTDVLGGQVEGVILGLGALSAHLRSGALKPIAISSPFPELPNVPTLGKLGYKQDLLGVWLAFLAPSGVPAEVTRALMPALERAAKSPALAERLLPLGIAQDWVPADRLAETITREYDTVSEISRKMKR